MAKWKCHLDENHDDVNPWARGMGLEKWSENKHEIGSIYGDHVPLLVRVESVGKYGWVKWK
jgi:hypothetical protein